MSEYQKITTLVRHGVSVDVTSRQLGNGSQLFSFMMAREYSDPEGNKRNTPWMQRRHIVDLRRLLDEVEDYLDDLEWKKVD